MPIQRLFTRHDQRVFPSTTKEEMVARVGEFLRQSQFSLGFVSPYQLHAEQYFAKLGLRRVMDVSVYDSGSDVGVAVDLSASLGDAEAAVGVVGALLVLPLAAAVGAVSYLDYESDAQALIASMWNYIGTSPAPGEAEPAVTVRCGNCGLEVDADSKFCKRCGAQLKV
jgi:hypothetical protein